MFCTTTDAYLYYETNHFITLQQIYDHHQKQYPKYQIDDLQYFRQLLHNALLDRFSHVHTSDDNYERYYFHERTLNIEEMVVQAEQWHTQHTDIIIGNHQLNDHTMSEHAVNKQI
jgi:hypothetical protein